MPYPGYIADNPSILSLWRLLNFSRYYMFGRGSMVRAHACPAESLRFEPDSMPWLYVRSLFTQQQMGTQWEQWGDKDGEERNWPPYLTRWWLSVSVLSNRHSPTYESIREYGNKLMEYQKTSLRISKQGWVDRLFRVTDPVKVHKIVTNDQSRLKIIQKSYLAQGVVSPIIKSSISAEQGTSVSFIFLHNCSLDIIYH